eukprot:m.1093094 g.1093094  ORF g.1093094 m.1093094 type:complete len:619 (-) comp24293_c0_seq20:378-2234(-)
MAESHGKVSPRATPEIRRKSSPKPKKKDGKNEYNVADMFKAEREAAFEGKKKNYEGQDSSQLLTSVEKIKSPAAVRRRDIVKSASNRNAKSPAQIRKNAVSRIDTSTPVSLPKIRSARGSPRSAGASLSGSGGSKWQPPGHTYGTAFGARSDMYRESSKKQAQRVRQEYAKRTRDLHIKIFVNPKEAAKVKQEQAREAKVRLLQSEQERAEAEAVFQSQLAEIEAKAKAQIEEYRTKAIALEKAARMKTMARSWMNKAHQAKFFGPYKVPSTKGDLEKMLPELQKTPKGSVVAFLLVLFRRMQRRTLGNEMLQQVMHPDCIQLTTLGDGSTARVIRKHTFKILHKMWPEALISYAVGTSPKSSYHFDPNNIKFEFDNLATTNTYGDGHDAQADVYVVTTGAPVSYPHSRPVHVRNVEGKWFVRQFQKLCAPVVRTLDNKLDSKAVYEESYWDGLPEEKQTEEAKLFAQEERVEARGFQGGFQRAPDFAAIKRRKAAQARKESEDARRERHKLAKDDTASLAHNLAQSEMLRRWENDPSAVKRVVDGEGNVEFHEVDFSTIQQLKKNHAEQVPKTLMRIDSHGDLAPTDSQPRIQIDDTDAKAAGDGTKDGGDTTASTE